MERIPSLDALLTRFTLRQLRLLVAIADNHSLVRAAEEIAMTQPGASKALREIEVALGLTLFHRTNRGLTPTECGSIAIRYARLVCTDLAHMREDLAGVAYGGGGRLSLGAIMGAIPLLTRAINEFVASHPDVSIEIVEDTSWALLKSLEKGRIALAVCRSGVSSNPARFDAIDLQQESLSVVANVRSPLLEHKRLTLEHLARLRWVVYSANMPMRLLLEKEFTRAGLAFPTRLLETTSAFATLSLLRSDRELVALLSSEVAADFARFELARILMYQVRSESEPYQLVTQRGTSASTLELAFIETLKRQQTDSPASMR